MKLMLVDDGSGVGWFPQFQSLKEIQYFGGGPVAWLPGHYFFFSGTLPIFH